MVGAVTTLIVIVAVFLAYNANNGLPFVPVYRVSVEVPNAARLVNNNEVRIGGYRVGVVESIEPVADRTTCRRPLPATVRWPAQAADDTGGVAALLNLKLDKTAEPLPQDSIFRVRYRSAFGLKYLEIVRGNGEDAPEGYIFNGTDDGGDCDAARRAPPPITPPSSRRQRLLPGADRVRRHQQHLRHRDARERRAGTSSASATRSPAAGSR